MYAVVILEEAQEDLINVVSHLGVHNPAAAETLGNQLIDKAQSLKSVPLRRPTQMPRFDAYSVWTIAPAQAMH